MGENVAFEPKIAEVETPRVVRTQLSPGSGLPTGRGEEDALARMRVEASKNEQPTRLERILEKSCQSKAGSGIYGLEVCERAGDADDG